MKLAVKVPYGVIAKPETETESRMIAIVDNMARGLRILDITNPLDEGARNELLAKHMESAYEYYKTFSPEDMATMIVVDNLLATASREEVSPDDE